MLARRSAGCKSLSACSCPPTSGRTTPSRPHNGMFVWFTASKSTIETAGDGGRDCYGGGRGGQGRFRVGRPCPAGAEAGTGAVMERRKQHTQASLEYLQKKRYPLCKNFQAADNYIDKIFASMTPHARGCLKTSSQAWARIPSTNSPVYKKNYSFSCTCTLSKNQWKVTGYPVTHVPLENSVESHRKFSEIPLETSENLLETS